MQWINGNHRCRSVVDEMLLRSAPTRKSFKIIGAFGFTLLISFNCMMVRNREEKDITDLYYVPA